jgi:ABC-type phosphate transport system permease subunit
MVFTITIICYFVWSYTHFLFNGWMQVVRNGDDAKSAGNGLKLESGLGIFDAFFASLSMILVSEVIGLSLSTAVFFWIDA